MPFALGEESDLSFRIDPGNLGAPVSWFRDIWNMPKGSDVTELISNSGAWNEDMIGPLQLAHIEELIKHDVKKKRKVRNAC